MKSVGVLTVNETVTAFPSREGIEKRTQADSTLVGLGQWQNGNWYLPVCKGRYGSAVGLRGKEGLTRDDGGKPERAIRALGIKPTVYTCRYANLHQLPSSTIWRANQNS